MMLDVTGSMGHSKKLRDLKIAAKNAVDAFLTGQNPKNPRVRVSIVPYADAVNVGAALANTVHVEKKFSSGQPPKLTDPLLVSGGGTRPDNCATERKGNFQFSDASPNKAMINRDYRLAYCPNAALMPLSADIASLKNTIDGFKASGYTAGHIGIQWSWYMLSPAVAFCVACRVRTKAIQQEQGRKSCHSDDRRSVQHSLCRWLARMEKPEAARPTDRVIMPNACVPR